MPPRNGPRLLFAGVLLFGWCTAAPVLAQRAPAPGRPELTRPNAPPPSDPDSGERLLGAEPAEALFGVDDERAIRRLGALGTDASVEQLAAAAAEPGNLSDRALVLLTRALVARAESPAAVRALSTILTRAGNESGTPRQSRLLSMAREQAALALAKGGAPEAVGLLARLVKRGHEDGELAARALAAHPPRNVRSLLDSPGTPNATFAAMLERLGDQRAFVPLREMVRRGSPDVQARAALALTRLGHLETVELAHHWLLHSRYPEQRAAATEILMQTHDEQAPAAWGKLYDTDPLVALPLALALPSAALAEPIAKRLGGSNDEQLLTALGHGGGTRALQLLGKQLASAQGATAAYSLARCPDDQAREVLREALASEHAKMRRLGVLGLVVRSFLYGESSGDVDTYAARLRASKDPADRWVGLWAGSALHPEFALSQLDSSSPLALSATLATAGVQPRSFFEHAAALLSRQKDAPRRELMGLALLDQSGRDAIDSHRLRGWIVGNSPLRSLAIAALCERRDERYETLVRSLLGSTDVETRSAAALGLARNRDPAATGLLVGAYEFEEVADVRLAVVIGLSQRDAGRARDDVLSSARDTDVDARVRSAARLALSGQRLSPWPVGDEVAWVTIPEGPVPAWLVVSASGAPSLPIPTGGQRLLPVLGVQSAGVGVRLAPGGAPGDDGS